VHWYGYPIIVLAMALGVYLRIKGRRRINPEHKADIQTLFDDEK